MASSERVTIRISEEQLRLIQALIDSGTCENITDVVRNALDEYLAKNFSPENIKKITLDIPRSNVIELEDLVRDGDSVSLDDAIRNAVREYTRARIPK